MKHIASFLNYTNKRIFYQKTTRKDLKVKKYVKKDTIKLLSILPDGTNKKILASILEISSYGQAILKQANMILSIVQDGEMVILGLI